MKGAGSGGNIPGPAFVHGVGNGHREGDVTTGATSMSHLAGRIVGMGIIAALVVGVYVLTRGGTAAPAPSPPVVAVTTSVPTSTTSPAVTVPPNSPVATPISTVSLATSTPPAIPSATPIPASTVQPNPVVGANPTQTLPPPATPAVSAPRATPATAPTGATRAVEFVARPGADPLLIAQRIAGPSAMVQRAPGVGAPPPPALQQRLARTWLVPIPPGQETQALSRAQQDPDVESALLVPWPPPVRFPM